MEIRERAIDSTSNDFILSDATIDRAGDVIEPRGWHLENFKRNPIALWGHKSDSPIGIWKNIRIEKDALRAELEFAKPGTSPLIDTIRTLYEQRIVRAVSVGFRALRAEPIAESNGVRFHETELLEASLVAVPANPSALAIAKQFNLDPQIRKLIFAAPGPGDQPCHPGEGRDKPGAPAAIQPSPKATPKMNIQVPIASRIQEAESALLALREKLAKRLNEDGLDGVDDLTIEIDNHERNLTTLKKVERIQGNSAEAVTPQTQLTPASNIIVPKGFPSFGKPKQIPPRDFISRALAVQLKSVTNMIPIPKVIEDNYPGDQITGILLKATTTPALTTTAGWAAELVNTVLTDFMESLNPYSVYVPLQNAGLPLNFGRDGVIKIPSRNRGTSIAGDFVGEAAPIPVRQLLLQSVSLTPKKMAVISTFSREIAMHSTPAIEGVIRDAIGEDTAITLDTRLLDTAAATAVRPAGLLNTSLISASGSGANTPIAGTAGGGSAAMIADLKALVNSIVAQNGGRKIVLIMAAAQALALRLATTTTGDFVDYAAKLGMPILTTTILPTSGAVSGGTGNYPIVIAVDAADFVGVAGNPDFLVSDTATLHMSDTPLATGLVGATTPPPALADIATPQRSLFQTAVLAVRMILDMNWSMRRDKMVSYVHTVTW